MQTMRAVDPATATGKAKELLDFVMKRTGRIPNMVRLMANSPAALNACLGFAGALRDAKLPAETQELIAIAVAEANGCDYALSAVSALGRSGGRSESDVAAARHAHARDPKTTAALRFAAKVVETRGHVEAVDVAALREAGFSDGEVAEVIAVVVLNTYRSFFNLVARPEIDFPLVKAGA
jgi:uncharacterized peroxidase-related enzyme